MILYEYMTILSICHFWSMIIDMFYSVFYISLLLTHEYYVSLISFFSKDEEKTAAQIGIGEGVPKADTEEV